MSEFDNEDDKIKELIEQVENDMVEQEILLTGIVEMIKIYEQLPDLSDFEKNQIWDWKEKVHGKQIGISIYHSQIEKIKEMLNGESFE